MLSIWTSPHPPVDPQLVATQPCPVARWQSTNKVDSDTHDNNYTIHCIHSSTKLTISTVRCSIDIKYRVVLYSKLTHNMSQSCIIHQLCNHLTTMQC